MPEQEHNPLILSCTRCLHTWLRRDLAKTPIACPRCHSSYWNRLRKRDMAKPPAAAEGGNDKSNAA